MKYIAIKEKLTNDEIGTYTAYGIKVVKDKQTVRIVSDVIVSYRKICKLCRLCNRMNLDAEQLDDIIEDAISGLWGL